MTAVLSPTNPLAARDRMTDDDEDLSYSHSSMDWKARYNEVAEMLAETRAELDDFHHTSKELEAELENELQRTEKAQQDLKVKVERAETERDQWKSKFMSLQTTHNTTTTSLQRELDQLRQEHQQLKVQLRELEMGNDDLERNERAVSSSLADVEAKYSKALEEKILLEHELFDKASVEEQCQRLKDELADANVEISVLRDQLAAQQASHSGPEASATLPSPLPSSEDLLATEPPPDLDLSDLTPGSESESPVLTTTPRAASANGRIDSLRNGASKPVFTPPSSTAGALARSSTLPTLSPALRHPRTPISRPVANRITSTVVNNAVPVKNKGVQMVSEMRARVRNLEQKIHTRVPRLRMASITGRGGPTAPTREKPPLEKNPFAPIPGSPKKHPGDTSGWVLIMEDSPSPPRPRDYERRRVTSPTRTSTSSSENSPTLTNLKLGMRNNNNATRRPQSRLSGGSMSTTTTSSLSRPTTPTMLPNPTPIASRYGTTEGMGIKRSTGPFSGTKRPSFGIDSPMPPPSEIPRARQTVSSPPTRPPSSTSSSHSHAESDTMLPRLPSLHSNITLRSSSARIPQSSTSSILSRSRIGKPQSRAFSGRRSVGEQNNDGAFLGTPHPSHKSKSEGRPRSGSAANALY